MFANEKFMHAVGKRKRMINF